MNFSTENPEKTLGVKRVTLDRDIFNNLVGDMERFPAILLAFLVLLQSTFWDMQDITRIDTLLEHARYHAEEYGDGFFVFLSKHYGDLQQDHEREHQEHSEHEDLPFHHQSFVPVLAHLAGLSQSLLPLKSWSLADSNGNYHYLDNYASIAKFDIFQPPRQV